MGEQVVAGAEIRCSFGSAPVALGELPSIRLQAEGRLAANIEDCVPFVNISPFGECSSEANPAVIAATAAADGVLTPQPCVPVIVDPWAPGVPDVRISGPLALNRQSVCACVWLGEITIAVPGTTRTEVS